MKEFANTAGYPIDLKDGRVIGTGERAKLKAEEIEDNQDRIDSGVLYEIQHEAAAPPPEDTTPPGRRGGGGSS